MAYCTRADIESLYGAKHLETLVASDVDLDAAVSRACAAASAVIDGYIGRRYRLPLATTPSIIHDYAVDIACWKVAPSHARLTDEIEKRAKAAIAYFVDVANGKANIAELETAAGTESGEISVASDDGAFFSANRRRFGGEGGMP